MPKDREVFPIGIYGGNLKTVSLTPEEVSSLVLLSEYASTNNMTHSAVYYRIRAGLIVAKKYRGRLHVMPVSYGRERPYSW